MMRDLQEPGSVFNGSVLTNSGFPGGSVAKNIPGNAGDVGLIPWLGRSPRGGNGNRLQYSSLRESHGQRRLVGCRHD